jgi:hypothetical protein
MSDDQTNDQTPTRRDFAHAAALYTHHIRGDVPGVTEIIRQAEADTRLTALLIAIVDTAIAEHGNTIATPEGQAGLQQTALDMDVADEAPDDDQRAHGQDFRRASAFFLHRMRRDQDGANAILAEAEDAGRGSALIIATAALGYLAPGSTLATPAGLAGLQRVALTMNADDTRDDEK